MSEQKAKSRYHAVVTSHIPGRMRVRLHKESRQTSVLHHLQHKLTERPGIDEVRVNETAGSLTVHYDAQRYPGSSLSDVLQDLEVILGTVLDAPLIAEPTVGPGQSQAAMSLATALDDLDHRISAVTGRSLNLRVLFPLGLAGIGIRQILKNGLMLETAPGWLLLWLAFDAFVKLRPQSASPTATLGEAQIGEGKA
jgi:Heavy metal associated domain 2